MHSDRLVDLADPMRPPLVDVLDFRQKVLNREESFRFKKRLHLDINL